MSYAPGLARAKQSDPAVQADNFGMTVATVRGGVEAIDSLAEEWRQLCDEGTVAEPFYRPEWIRACVRAFEPGKTVVLVTARMGGQLRAVLPLVEERTSNLGWTVTRLRGAANIHSSRFDLVRSAGPQGDRAAMAIWDQLKNLAWDVLEFPFVPEGGALEGWKVAAEQDGFHTAKVNSLQMPYVQLVPWEGGWDWWLGRLSGNFRHNLRRRVRKLPEQPRLRRVDSADPRALQLFYEIERGGWKGTDGGAISCNSSTLQFYNEIALAAERFGYLTFYFLDIGGRTVAAQFGLTYRGRYFAPKCAYDETASEASPGHLLVNSILRDCANRGLTEFDFLGPWMEWKAHWTSLVHRHNTLYIFRDSASGSALHAAQFGWRSLAKKVLGPELVQWAINRWRTA